MTVMDAMRYQTGIEVLEKAVRREEEKLARLRQLEEEKRALADYFITDYFELLQGLKGI